MTDVDKSAAVYRPGSCYSNGDFGSHWQVRQVIAVNAAGVSYKVMAGEGRRHSYTCSRSEFHAWARYEVERDESSWRKRRDMR